MVFASHLRTLARLSGIVDATPAGGRIARALSRNLAAPSWDVDAMRYIPCQPEDLWPIYRCDYFGLVDKKYLVQLRPEWSPRPLSRVLRTHNKKQPLPIVSFYWGAPFNLLGKASRWSHESLSGTARADSVVALNRGRIEDHLPLPPEISLPSKGQPTTWSLIERAVKAKFPQAFAELPRSADASRRDSFRQLGFQRTAHPKRPQRTPNPRRRR